MDTNKGYFEGIDPEKFSEHMAKEKPQVFRVGEILEIRGSRLRVETIKRNKIVLKLLKPINSKPGLLARNKK